MPQEYRRLVPQEYRRLVQCAAGVQEVSAMESLSKLTTVILSQCIFSAVSFGRWNLSIISSEYT